MRVPNLKNFARRLVNFYWGSGIADDVPALTYYLLVSLAPFCLGLAALGALLFGDELSPRLVAEEVARYLPMDIRDEIVALVEGTKRDSPWLLALALVAMLWTASGAIGVIERCVSRITQARRYPLVLGRLYHVLVGAALAMLLIVSAMGASLVGGLAEQMPAAGPWMARGFALASFLGALGFCTVIFRYAARQRLRWRAALFGALPASVVMQLAPLLVGWYFDVFARFAATSVFLSIAVVLLGCLMLAQGLLLGAGIAARVHLRLAPLPSV